MRVRDAGSNGLHEDSIVVPAPSSMLLLANTAEMLGGREKLEAQR